MSYLSIFYYKQGSERYCSLEFETRLSFVIIIIMMKLSQLRLVYNRIVNIRRILGLLSTCQCFTFTGNQTKKI